MIDCPTAEAAQRADSFGWHNTHVVLAISADDACMPVKKAANANPRDSQEHASGYKPTAWPHQAPGIYSVRMLRTCFGSLPLLFVCTGGLAAAITRPVPVEGGVLAGTPGRDPSITAFKGIPFAAPPVGDLRWRQPKPVIAWTGVRKLGDFGSSCIQTIHNELKPWTYEFMTHNQISEDCLYLNVWTPAKSVTEKRPVFVYIYGGGFNSGSGAVPLYDGEGLATKGLVVVTFNYRVGVFGFLALPELTRE